MSRAEELARPIKDAINVLVLDKSIDRHTLIEVIEEIASEVEGLIDGLHEDEERVSRPVD